MEGAVERSEAHHAASVGLAPLDRTLGHVKTWRSMGLALAVAVPAGFAREKSC